MSSRHESLDRTIDPDPSPPVLAGRRPPEEANPGTNSETNRGTNPPLALLGLAGVLSAAFLVAATVLGGALRPGYDHVSYTISVLYEVGAPNAVLLMVLFTAYHALVIPLALGLHRALPANPRGWVGPLLLATVGALGIPLGAYARCDVGSASGPPPSRGASTASSWRSPYPSSSRPCSPCGGG